MSCTLTVMICLVPMVEQKRFVDVEGGDAAVFAAVLVDGVGDEAAPSSRLSKSTLRDPTPFRLADACCFVLIFRVSSFGGCWRDCCTVLPIFLFHYLAHWHFFKNVAFPIPPPPLLWCDSETVQNKKFIQALRGKKKPPSFVTPTAARDQVNYRM